LVDEGIVIMNLINDNVGSSWKPFNLVGNCDSPHMKSYWMMVKCTIWENLFQLYVLEKKFGNQFNKLHHEATTFYNAMKVLDNNTMGFNAQQITKKMRPYQYYQHDLLIPNLVYKHTVQRKIKWIRLIIPPLYYVEDIGNNLNLC